MTILWKECRGSADELTEVLSQEFRLNWLRSTNCVVAFRASVYLGYDGYLCFGFRAVPVSVSRPALFLF